MYDNNPDTDTSNQFQMSKEALTNLGENVDAEKASRQQIQEFTGQAQQQTTLCVRILLSLAWWTLVPASFKYPASLSVLLWNRSCSNLI